MAEKFIDENLQANNFGNFENAPANDEVAENTEEEEVQDPSLREFTLIISKLLFHLSQMQ